MQKLTFDHHGNASKEPEEIKQSENWVCQQSSWFWFCSGSLQRVCSVQPEMTVQRRAVLKTFLTHAAWERALPRMGPPVDHQMDVLVETFTTELTCEQFLIHVGSHVN